MAMEHGAGGQAIIHEPDGNLHPILIDHLGAPVAAAWTPAEGGQRWYILPAAPGWDSVLDWLVRHALPAYVPQALRRARSPLLADPDLQTPQIAAVEAALADLDATYQQARAQLQTQLQKAREAAAPIRDGLLYGTGDDLVDAVDQVLIAAGFTTVNLDQDLGASKSADLLVTLNGDRRLIEVKSAGGNAGERLVNDLRRHLDTWPHLRPGTPVNSGALIVNHQFRLHPAQRSPQVYSRPEFTAVLPVPVISTWSLFDWWRNSDWAAIQAAVLGASPPPNAQPAGSDTSTASSASELGRPTPGRARRRWPSWWRSGVDR